DRPRSGRSHWNLLFGAPRESELRGIDRLWSRRGDVRRARRQRFDDALRRALGRPLSPWRRTLRRRLLLRLARGGGRPGGRGRRRGPRRRVGRSTEGRRGGDEVDDVYLRLVDARAEERGQGQRGPEAQHVREEGHGDEPVGRRVLGEGDEAAGDP